MRTAGGAPYNSGNWSSKRSVSETSPGDPAARIFRITGGDGQNINSLFQSSFDAWNAGNALGSKWTLNFGGDTLGGTFHIYGDSTASAARAAQFDGSNSPTTTNVVKGGLDMMITWKA